jgi:hypothetical protein
LCKCGADYGIDKESNSTGPFEFLASPRNILVISRVLTVVFLVHLFSPEILRESLLSFWALL